MGVLTKKYVIEDARTKRDVAFNYGKIETVGEKKTVSSQINKREW